MDVLALPAVVGPGRPPSHQKVRFIFTLTCLLLEWHAHLQVLRPGLVQQVPKCFLTFSFFFLLLAMFQMYCVCAPELLLVETRVQHAYEHVALP
jgi:hypothetical protein